MIAFRDLQQYLRASVMPSCSIPRRMDSVSGSSAHLRPDLHDALATEIRNDLNQTLPTPYYAPPGDAPRIGDHRRASCSTANHPGRHRRHGILVRLTSRMLDKAWQF